jgi:hypothetical protein
VVPAAANGQQVLDAVADIRTSKGMLCGVDGYPASGCGAPVKNVTATGNEPDVDFALPSAAATKNVSSNQDARTSTPLLVGGVVILVLLVGGGVALSRRSRTA